MSFPNFFQFCENLKLFFRLLIPVLMTRLSHKYTARSPLKGKGSERFSVEHETKVAYA